MLVLLWELSKMHFAKVDQAGKETVEEFQEILVDYIAAGHFGIVPTHSARQGTPKSGAGCCPRDLSSDRQDHRHNGRVHGETRHPGERHDRR